MWIFLTLHCYKSGISIQRGNDQEQRHALGLVKSSQRKDNTEVHPSSAGNTKAHVEVSLTIFFPFHLR